MSTTTTTPCRSAPLAPLGAQSPPKTGPAATLRRLCTPVVLGGTIIALAAAVRLVQLGEPSLTAYEARQTNAVLENGPAGLHTLPPLVALLSRATVNLLGRSEIAVRLPYALAGVVLVALLFEFCRRRINPYAAVPVAAVAAVHPALLTSARSTSIGSVEAAFAVALVWVGLTAFSNPTRRSLVTFAVVSTLALACTFTSLLLIAAWLPLLIWAVYRPQGAHARPWPSALATLAVLATACWAWFWWFDGNVNDQVFSRGHEVPFRIWPWGFSAAQLSEWGANVAYGMMGYARTEPGLAGPLAWMTGGLSLVAAAFGIRLLWQRCRVVLALGVLLLAAIGLALLIDHPLLEMLQSLVYLYPLICICVGTGLWVMLQRVKHPALAIALIGGVLLLPGQHAVRAEMIGPATPQHLRPILQYIAANKQSTDAVFVWHEAVDAFRFYWHDRTGPVYLQPPEDPSVKVQFRRGDFLKQIDAAVARQGRVWLVFTHGWDDDKMSYLTRLQKYATEFEVYTLSHEHTVGDASARLLRDATHEHL